MLAQIPKLIGYILVLSENLVEIFYHLTKVKEELEVSKNIFVEKNETTT